MAWTFECNYTEEGLTLYSLKKDAKGAQKINQGILQNFSFYILQKKESNAGKKKKKNVRVGSWWQNVWGELF